MRIMLLVPMLHQGGFERICAMTARLLNEKHDVHLVIFSSEDMIYDVSGVHLINLDLGAVSGKLGKLTNILKRVRRLRKIKRDLDIQITYSFGTTANLANVLSKMQDKVWVGIRGYGALEEHLSFLSGHADRVVSCTRVMEQDISRLVKVKKSATLYNPCDVAQIQELSKEPIPDEFADFINRPGQIIISMGREDDLKGFWHLLKSISLARKAIPDLKLIIIGDGSYQEYKKLACELEIEKDVLFTGVMKNPFPLLKCADVYALTSESEGFPNALIEAMAVGVPCVSVNCKTGPAEILQEDYQACCNQKETYREGYGILTPVFDGLKDLNPQSFTKEEQMFADELVQLLKDEKKRNSLREKSLKRAQDFSIESYLKSLEKLILEDIG